MTTINVRIEKNSPRIPHPSGLRPFIIAITPQIIAAIMLPMATKIPLMPRRIKPAAIGSELAKITECNMTGPFVRGHEVIPERMRRETASPKEPRAETR